MANPCVICSKPVQKYLLCADHWKMKREGTVVKCETCGTWHETSSVCKCGPTSEQTPQLTTEPKNSKPQIKQNSIDKPQPIDVSLINKEGCCLTCGNPAEGKMFCKTCYHKYQHKTLLLKIKDCNQVELLDESYDGIFVCDDGHVVKSKSERDIDNFLFNNDYKHVYEAECYFDDGTPYHPDFYLPKQDKIEHEVYIEHWGYDESNSRYTEIKNRKMDHYKTHAITLICTYEKTDAKNIRSRLEYKLRNYKANQVNFEE